jgi:hypothetical protein
MLSPDNRRVLNRNGIEVVRAIYQKQLAVNVLPRDSDQLVDFSGGRVPLGEVDEWLQEYTKRQSTQARNALVISIISIAIAAASLVVALLAFCKG